MPSDPIYLDYNATTPISPEVAEAMRPWLEGRFGNASSAHGWGTAARHAVESARRQVAAFLGCEPDEIVFTSGGSESNNLALEGVALARQGRGGHVVTSAIEHPAVLEVCRYLETRGVCVTRLPVDAHGLVAPASLEAALRPETVLVSIQHANNEVGTIEPIAELSALARHRGVLFHTDAAQSAGKIATDVRTLGVDLLTLAGHKLYAPQGVGALYRRRGVELARQVHGASQERGLRAGTESVMLAVGLGQACEVAARDLGAGERHAREMRDRLHEGLARAVSGVRLNGHPERRLPNTLSLGFKGIEATALLSRVEAVGASAGAACHAGTTSISHVLSAMEVPPEYARGTVRFSTGRATTAAEIDRAVAKISEAIQAMRAES